VRVSLRSRAKVDLVLWLDNYEDPEVDLHSERWSLASHPNLAAFVKDASWVLRTRANRDTVFAACDADAHKGLVVTMMWGFNNEATGAGRVEKFLSGANARQEDQ
jgi:hypothetical protein